MDFDSSFPLKFWLNLGRREDRRLETEARLAEAGISAERFAAIDAKILERRPLKNFASTRISPLKSPLPAVIGDMKVAPPRPSQGFKGYENVGRYALALTQRLAIREAGLRKAPSVLLFEDDVILHPNFEQLISTVELPEDWGIFYLGCTHCTPPAWAGSRVVKATYAVDTHAIAIHSRYFDKILEVLDRHGKPDLGVPLASDQFIATLHSLIPAYACYPNLAWQAVSHSDLIERNYSNYGRDGKQINWSTSVDHLLPEMLGLPSGPTPTEKIVILPGKARGMSPQIARIAKKDLPKLGLLFLTKGGVNNPEIWEEFVSEAPDRVRIFSHSKDRSVKESGFLEGTEIADHHPTEWAGIGLVKASRSMLVEALEDDSLTHFVLLSESCVPIRPLPEILKRIGLDPRSQFGFKTLEECGLARMNRARAVPQIPGGCWRFQSQWWLMDRIAAIFAASLDFTDLFAEMVVPDEAYFATILALQGYPLDGNVIKDDVTWTHWDNASGGPNEWGFLPKEMLNSMTRSNALFARKFPPEADIAQFGLHRTQN